MKDHLEIINKRREFLQRSAIGFGTLASATLLGTALSIETHARGLPREGDISNTAPVPQPIIQISPNHGHELSLSLLDLLKLLREAQSTGPNELSIRGTGTHNHNIHLNVSDIFSILAEGEVELESSKTGGHSHGVTISLELDEEEKTKKELRLSR